MAVDCIVALAQMHNFSKKNPHLYSQPNYESAQLHHFVFVQDGVDSLVVSSLYTHSFIVSYFINRTFINWMVLLLVNRLVVLAHDTGAAAEAEGLANGEIGATGVDRGIVLDELVDGHTVLSGNGGADIARLDGVGGG